MAFWEVAVPNTGPSQARAAVARTRVSPVPAGPVITSTGRPGQDVPDGGGLVQPQPARRGVLARVVRAAAQLRLKHCRVGAQAPRRLTGRQPRRALRLRVRDQLVFQGKLRGGGVPRDAGT